MEIQNGHDTNLWFTVRRAGQASAYLAVDRSEPDQTKLHWSFKNSLRESLTKYGLLTIIYGIKHSTGGIRVSQNPKKSEMKRRLFQIGVDALEADGWRVEKIAGERNMSVRMITKRSKRYVAAIRTTQDTYFGFGVEGLKIEDVEFVVVSSVDNKDHSKFALVHLFPKNEVQKRFDLHKAARIKHGHGGGVGLNMNWVPLYHTSSRLQDIGGGIGNDIPPFARVPLDARTGAGSTAEATSNKVEVDAARERIARAAKVAVEAVKITIDF